MQDQVISVYAVGYNGTVIEQNALIKQLATHWHIVNYRSDNDPSNSGPDLIIHYYCKLIPGYIAIKNYKRKWGDKPFILLVTAESDHFTRLANISNYNFSYQADSDNNDYYPSLLLAIPYNIFYQNGAFTAADRAFPFFQPSLKTKATQNDMNVITNSFPKQKFCNFIYNHNRGDSKIRQDFTQRLAAYKAIDCAGKVLNNTPVLQRKSPAHSKRWVKHKLHYIAQHKFTIAFENKRQSFYITEKILHAFIVGSIPIYWGCPEVARFFNPNSFINCHDYDSFAAVIAAVKKIDRDPVLYERYLNAPKILTDSLLYNWTPDKKAERLQRLLQRVITHQESHPKQKWWQSMMLRLKYLDLEWGVVKYQIRKRGGVL